MKNKLSLALVLTFLTAGLMPVTLLHSAPLKSATVTEIKNDVNLEKEGSGERAAKKQDTLVGKDRLWTGKKSRAELEFSDKSIARLGANTRFSFDPTGRNMRVDRGTALIHVPPGQDGARISSPAATAAIMGDVVAMRVDGKGVTQIVALSKDAQGPIKVTFNKTGETRTLQAGEMLTIDPMATKLPEPLTVAVDVFVQTSGLASGFEKKLPDSAEKEIKQTEELQAKEIKSGNLEGDGKLVVKNDSNTLVQSGGVNNTTVQSTTGQSFAGRYTGLSKAIQPASGSEKLTVDINADGTFSFTSVDSFSGFTTTGSGTVGTDGGLSGSGSDGSFTGTASGGSTITGTIIHANPFPPPPTATYNYSISK